MYVTFSLPNLPLCYMYTYEKIMHKKKSELVSRRFQNKYSYRILGVYFCKWKAFFFSYYYFFFTLENSAFDVLELIRNTNDANKTDMGITFQNMHMHRIRLFPCFKLNLF